MCSILSVRVMRCISRDESTGFSNRLAHLDVWVGPMKSLDVVCRQCASPPL